MSGDAPVLLCMLATRAGSRMLLYESVFTASQLTERRELLHSEASHVMAKVVYEGEPHVPSTFSEEEDGVGWDDDYMREVREMGTGFPVAMLRIAPDDEYSQRLLAQQLAKRPGGGSIASGGEVPVFGIVQYASK
jgi:hypothetical protein